MLRSELDSREGVQDTQEASTLTKEVRFTNKKQATKCQSKVS